MKNPSEKDKKHFQQAMQALHGGQPKDAIRLFEKVLKAGSYHPDIGYLLGLAHGKLGEFDQVKRVSLRALDVAPNHFGALCNLANAQMMLSDQEGALVNYGKALKANPDDPTVINNYGRALGLLGRWDEAIKHFEQILERNHNYAPAHSSLGKAYAEGGIPNKAFDEYHKSLALDEKQVDALLGLGHLYSGLGGVQNAEYCFEKALKIEPRSTDAMVGMATMKRYLGAFDEALDLLDQCDRITPGMPTVKVSRADVLERSSRYEEANAILQELIQTDQLNALGMNVFASLCHKMNNCDEALRLIDEALKAPQYNLMEKQMLRYAAGKLLDKLDRFDEAFEWYRDANETIQVPCNLDENQKQAEELMSFFTRSSMQSLPRATTGSSRPIFILGMPRSGTTLTETILSCHPEVHGAGELSDLKRTLNSMGDQSSNTPVTYLDTLSGFNENDMNKFAQQYLDVLTSINTDARHVTDKMPHNFLSIGAIALLFPEAHIIHCRRNSMDNGLSVYFQNFSWQHNYATDLENIGRFYAIYDQIMKHWEKVVDIPIMTVNYEDMVEDQEAMSRKLMDFVGLDWDDSLLDFHKSKRSVATASYDQVRQPIYTRSRERWRNYEKNLEPLKASIKKWSRE